MSPTPPLPLDRWANAVATIHTHYGVGDMLTSGGPLLTAVASLLFGVSALLWQVLGSLVTAAQGASTVQATADHVDPVYQRIGGILLGSGGTSLVMVVVVVGAALAAYQASRRGDGVGGALRGLAGVLVPVAALVVTVHAAAGSTGTAGVRGSPGWAASRVSGWTTSLSGSVASLAGAVTPSTPPTLTDGPGTGGPDCSGYVQGLEHLYATEQTQPGSGPPGLQGADAVELSRLWEGAVMGPWVTAQFGTSPLGARTYCHLLEIQGDVPAGDQQAAMAADTPTAGSAPAWPQMLASVGTPSAAVLGPGFAGGDDDLRRTMIAWAACDWVGPAAAPTTHGWQMDPAFRALSGTPPTPADCAAWWGQGAADPAPETSGPFDFDDQRAIVAATAGAPAARSYIEALDGQDPGLALSTSLLALAASLTYALSLGGLALGVLIGKVCLILLVSCLPLLLVLAAIPTAATRTAARRATGLLAAACLSSFVCSILLGVLMLMIGLLQAACAQMLPTSGALQGLAQALVPLAALLVLRRLLRPVGLAQVTSLRGVLRTTATLGRAGAVVPAAVPAGALLPGLGPLRSRVAADGPSPGPLPSRSSGGGPRSAGGLPTAAGWAPGPSRRREGPPPALRWPGAPPAGAGPPSVCRPTGSSPPSSVVRTSPASVVRSQPVALSSTAGRGRPGPMAVTSADAAAVGRAGHPGPAHPGGSTVPPLVGPSGTGPADGAGHDEVVVVRYDATTGAPLPAGGPDRPPTLEAQGRWTDES